MFLKVPKKLLMKKEGKTNPRCDQKNTLQYSPNSHLSAAILKFIHQQCNAIVVRTPPDENHIREV